MVLPTSPQLRDGFGDLSSLTPAQLQRLLDPLIPQKLMYSLYLVASLCNSRVTTTVRCSGGVGMNAIGEGFRRRLSLWWGIYWLWFGWSLSWDLGRPVVFWT